VIAAILERPAPSAAEVAPLALDRVLRRCLEKDPKNRWQSARDLKAALELMALPSAPATPTPVKRNWIPWVAAAAVVVAAVSAFALRFAEKGAPVAVTRFQIPAPENTTFEFVQEDVPLLAVSPDGRRVVFTADSRDGTRQLWIRPLDSPRAKLLADTDGARSPFWSPDGRFIGFFADGKLKKIDTSGGPALPLADVGLALGGSWSPDGIVVCSARVCAVAASDSGNTASIGTINAPWLDFSSMLAIS
jgi:hypothetical protein